ncbi:hypothetical protein DFH11DRAFT_1546671 [Phellopilus nigrolimitatus]|nr:hypothetical protein DFH11DRAFT_1546671 [Phellopilus nigrolimitatus]
MALFKSKFLDYYLDLGENPIVPPMRNTGTAAGTKAVSKKELSTVKKHRLHGIAYIPNLVEKDIMGHAQQIAKKKKLDTGDDSTKMWLAHVDPKYTTAHTFLPPVINSEQDSRDWFNTVLARPALSALHYCKDKNTVSTGKDPLAITPYLASSSGEKGVIPDGILVKGEWTVFKKKGKTMLTIEMKTPNALGNTFDKLLRKRYKSGKAVVVPFVWPKKEDSTVDAVTRILTQVWAQLMANNADCAMLSTYDQTIHVYRNSKDRDNILYMSRAIALDKNSLRRTFAWMTLAFGDTELPKDRAFSVPEVDKHCLTLFREGREGQYDPGPIYSLDEVPLDESRRLV